MRNQAAPSRSRRAPVVPLCLAELFCVAATTSPVVSGLVLRTDVLHGRLSSERALAQVVAAGAVMAILSQPLFGWLGDRTARRSGHRTGWLVGGAILGAAALQVAAGAGSLAGLTIAWMVAHAGFGAAVANLYAELPDVVAEPDRPRASALFAASASAALFVSAGAAAALPQNARVQLSVLPVVAVVATCAAAWSLIRAERSGTRVATVATVAASAARPSGFGRLWWQRIVAQCAWTVAILFGANLLVRRTGAELEHATATAGAIGSVSALVGAGVAVWLAPRLIARIGFRRTLALGLVVILATNLALAVATSVAAYAVALVATGAGVGIYTAPDLALALPLLAPGREGRTLGFFGAARNLPGALVPALAPLLFALGHDVVGSDRSQDYFAYFGAGAALTVLALVLVPLVPTPEASGPVTEPVERDVAMT